MTMKEVYNLARVAVDAFTSTSHRAPSAESFFRGYWQCYVSFHPATFEWRAKFIEEAKKELESR